MPNEIQLGRLVELQVAICAVQVSKGKHIMLLKLRSICILDRTCVTVSVFLLLFYCIHHTADDILGP